MKPIVRTPLNTYLELEENYQIPFISKMVNFEEPQRSAFHHIMKTKIEADEHLTKDIREKVGLNAKHVTTNRNIRPLLEQIHQSNVWVCCDRFITGTEELNWINKKTTK
jgi:hypothetical protein